MTRAIGAGTAETPGDIQFEVRDGMRRVMCHVSEEALEAASGLSAPSTTALRRRSFDRFRGLIDAAAKLKLKTLTPGWVGQKTHTRTRKRAGIAGGNRDGTVRRPVS